MRTLLFVLHLMEPNYQLHQSVITFVSFMALRAVLCDTRRAKCVSSRRMHVPHGQRRQTTWKFNYGREMLCGISFILMGKVDTKYCGLC